MVKIINMQIFDHNNVDKSKLRRPPMYGGKVEDESTFNFKKGIVGPPTCDIKRNIHCNGCIFLNKEESGNPAARVAWYCTKNDPAEGRLIKHTTESIPLIQKPFWCDYLKEIVQEGLEKAINQNNIKPLPGIEEKKARADKWKAIKGITSWEDIKVGKTYHLPPTIDKKRCDIKIVSKYYNQITGKNIVDNKYVYLYKLDEEYKFLKEI